MRGAVGLKSITPIRAIPRLDDLVQMLGVLSRFLDSEAPARLDEIARKTEQCNELIGRANVVAEREAAVSEREMRVEADEAALKDNVKQLNAILSAA